MSTQRKYLTFGQLARELPAPNGTPVFPCTVGRWATRGVRGHRLATTLVGGRRLTTWEDYLAFAESLRAGDRAVDHIAVPAGRTPMRIRQAEQVLHDAGM
jgi:hypothetical protein